MRVRRRRLRHGLDPADAIGRRLSRLASRVQVLSVTHAPQIAARADEHYLISKDAVADSTERVATAVNRIEGGARREEIAEGTW